LAQRRTRGHLAHPQGAGIEFVLAPALDRIEITFTGSEQAHVTAQHIAELDAIALGKACVQNVEIHKVAERRADEHQAGLARQEDRLALLEFELDHRSLASDWRNSMQSGASPHQFSP
jgi:hypothetical protein